MPGVSRAQRAEAKYNVVLDFANFGLHTAALSGNLGLVKYALDHGQPVNSAVEGVLPLHAACYNGHDFVVRLLIEHGADVNAQRLPRRYSTEKSRSASQPLSIVGPSGSTPLHFASYNGHTTVVLTLLLHGAHPDRPDKHGTTPEVLARHNAHIHCADVLREWSHNKDKDLREREALVAQSAEDALPKDDKSHPYCGSLECKECATRKRIRMKRSIDNAIHLLRPSSNGVAGSFVSTLNQLPSPTERSYGDLNYYHNSDVILDDVPPRRPSLPHVLEIPMTRSSMSSTRSRRPSNLSSASSTHRPRSAGNDAEGSPRLVKGKMSLLGIFKKANDPMSPPDNNSSSGSAVTSTSASPAPVSALTMTSVTSPSSETPESAISETHPTPPSSTRTHQRLLSETAAFVSPPHSADLHHSISRDSMRGRGQVSMGSNEALGRGTPSTRMGILRAHARSSSSSQATPLMLDSVRSASGSQSSIRALRFDSSSSGRGSLPRRTASHARSPRDGSRSPTRGVHGRSSFHSLRSPSPDAPWGLRFESEPEPMSAPTISPECAEDVRTYIEEEDEEEYGKPVDPKASMIDLEGRLANSDTGRARRGSVESAASDVDSQDTMHHVFRCPFSINQPPSVEDVQETPDSQLLGRFSSDSRVRGNSMSSMITDSSGGPPSSCVPTPSTHESTLPGAMYFTSSSYGPTEPAMFEVIEEKKASIEQIEVVPTPKRLRLPLDIDIRKISTHAQAEALVALAQQRILDMTDDTDEDDLQSISANVGEGRTPLSARLAAYGESLAIERKFKEVEEQRRRSLNVITTPTSTTRRSLDTGDFSRRSIAPRLDRQFSLQERQRGSPLDETWQRPHSSSSTPVSDSVNALFTSAQARRDQAAISNPEPSGNAAGAPSGASLTPPTTSHVQSRSENLPSERQIIPRSRTPDPESSFPYGAPLTRFPTCPTEDTYDNRKGTLTVKERQAARAQKLVKMGFQSGGESWREVSSTMSRSNRQRFGGIKTLVQSLTGRA